MRILPEPLAFEWDLGNRGKSLKKHKISPEESEQVFEGEMFILLDDTRHSLAESRMLIIGPSKANRLLSVIFTIRESRVRIISARPAAKKERIIYEKTFKNS